VVEPKKKVDFFLSSGGKGHAGFPVGGEAARSEAGTWTVPFRSDLLPHPPTQNFDFLDEIKGLRGKNRPDSM